MPACDTFTVSITLRPRNGIQDNEVGVFSRWVGALPDVVKAGAVLEEPGTPAQHLHCGILFKEKVKADNVKRRLWTLFANQLKQDKDWEVRDVAIRCTAHKDFNGLVGGYFQKEAHLKVFMTNVSEDELRKGQDIYSDAIAKKANNACTRTGLLPALVAYYHEQMDARKDPGMAWLIDEEPVAPLSPEDCMKGLIARGKAGYLIHWPQQRKSIIQFWSELTSAYKV